MTTTIRSFLLLSLLGTGLLAAVPPAEEQLAAAILAAPEDRRADAAVLGWDADGGVVMLREGSNEMVCLAADPSAPRWSVACDHQDLDPFMARGRQLAAAGVSGSERAATRFEEIEAGTLAMPLEPRTLYVLHGSGFDAEAGEVQEAYLRWVIYVPYATEVSTGLSTKPSEGAPWLMGAGTAGAHIMINPPRPGQ